MEQNNMSDEQNISDEEKRKAYERRRFTMSVRFNGAQRNALERIYWQEERRDKSMSSLIREATMEYLRLKYNINIPPHLNFVNE